MSTTEKINLLSRVASLDIAPEFTDYSKVIIHVNDEEAIEVGNDTGRTLEITNPFGTRSMALQLLASLYGYQYQPLYATSALLDPAAEIGDGVSIKGIYGGIYQRVRTFNQLMPADIAAPHEEEINHEYQFIPPEERRFTRQVGAVRASLLIQSDRITAEVNARTAQGEQFASQLSAQAQEISAKVSQTGGNNSSFGWSLKASEFGLYSNSKKVFYVNSGGAHVSGEITASSGKIGNFNIGTKSIWNNISEYGGTQTTGVYVGTNGIQLGQNFKVNSSGNVTAKNLTLSGGSITLGDNFKVDSSGNVTAKGMTLSGTLTIGGQTITSSVLRSGAQSAYNNGSYWSGGAAGGYNFSSASTVGGDYQSYFRAGQIQAETGLGCSGTIAGPTLSITGSFTFQDEPLSLRTKIINGTTIRYLGSA